MSKIFKEDAVPTNTAAAGNPPSIDNKVVVPKKRMPTLTRGMRRSGIGYTDVGDVNASGAAMSESEGRVMSKAKTLRALKESLSSRGGRSAMHYFDDEDMERSMSTVSLHETKEEKTELEKQLGSFRSMVTTGIRPWGFGYGYGDGYEGAEGGAAGGESGGGGGDGGGGGA